VQGFNNSTGWGREFGVAEGQEIEGEDGEGFTPPDRK